MNLVNEIDLDTMPQPYIESHPEWIDLYNYAWKIAAGNIRECNGIRYMDCAWDTSRNFQWVWDTCFMTLYARYSNGKFPGITSLDNFYTYQREDGFIAMTYDLNTGKTVYGERINPPLFAWCEWEYFKTTGDYSRFSTVVPKIEKLMDWIDANRRSPSRKIRLPVKKETDCHNKEKDDTGTSYPFYFFVDCGSSGMDDSPRTPREPQAGHFFDWIDLSSQMVLSFRMLARMNTVLGQHEKNKYWCRRAEELDNAINMELWCEKTGFYHDRSACPNFVSTKTVASFWTILAGVAKEKKLESLIGYLKDEKTFNRPIPVPTLAADDCNYCEDGTYWLGGVWAPTNYMIIRGLKSSGNEQLAYEIAIKYLKGLSETFKSVKPHSLWESYCAEKPLPGRNAYDRAFVKSEFVGWTGIGPIAILIENILGIELNAPQQQIDWAIRLTESHGIKNLKMGDITVDLDCKFTGNHPTTPLVSILANSNITVNIIYQGYSTILSVEKNKLLYKEIKKIK